MAKATYRKKGMYLGLWFQRVKSPSESQLGSLPANKDASWSSKPRIHLELQAGSIESEIKAALVAHVF